MYISAILSHGWVSIFTADGVFDRFFRDLVPALTGETSSGASSFLFPRWLARWGGFSEGESWRRPLSDSAGAIEMASGVAKSPWGYPILGRALRWVEVKGSRPALCPVGKYQSKLERMCMSNGLVKHPMRLHTSERRASHNISLQISPFGWPILYRVRDSAFVLRIDCR